MPRVKPGTVVDAVSCSGIGDLRVLAYKAVAFMARWGRRVLALLLLCWILLLAVRCHLPRQTLSDDAGRDSTSAVYVIRHGWHAGIAVRRSDVPDGRWPVLDEYPEAEYVEVGWGEARYYPGFSRGIWGILRAGLWPTESVLHIVPLSASVAETFPQNTIVRVPVGASELDALTTFVAESFVTDSAGTGKPVAPGYYAGSHFYESPLPYHVFNNCNHWAAAALEAAGCDVAPRWTFRVEQVMNEARECGALVQRRQGD